MISPRPAPGTLATLAEDVSGAIDAISSLQTARDAARAVGLPGAIASRGEALTALPEAIQVGRAIAPIGRSEDRP